MLVRKTLERKNVDGHVMTMQFTIHAYGFCHNNDNYNYKQVIIKKTYYM